MTYAHKHDDIARCQELLGQLNAYVDGELAAELCHDLELHLADWPDCRVVFDTLAKTIALYWFSWCECLTQIDRHRHNPRGYTRWRG
jgi:hypothetical protein